ncbi:MAG: hypothetical protein KME45_28655 [Stenomitos rutilans HA7619-LM2]|jgi:hypothetical protein|nr:hypothetical protein [Stenomitos rutilans HA7619-LM2]
MKQSKRFSSPELFPEDPPELPDLELPLACCTAQEIVAALMLQHHNTRLMQQVLTDLEANAHTWDAFLLAPSLPTVDSSADRGSLMCLRDLQTCWNADTLYILARNANTARSLQTIAQAWNCSDITLYPPKRMKRLTGVEGAKRLISTRWHFPENIETRIDFDQIPHPDSPKWVLDEMTVLEECSPQHLMAELMIKADSKCFHAQTILKELQDYSHWWRSFVLAPPLPDTKTGMTNRLNILQQLPTAWRDDCLYIWAWDDTAARNLRLLAQNWYCGEVTAIAGDEAARLLNVPNASPIIVVRWL